MKKFAITILTVLCAIALCGCGTESTVTTPPTQSEAETQAVPPATILETIAETEAPAEVRNEEFFYGTWKFSKVTMRDVTLSLDEWIKLGADASFQDVAFVFQDTGKCYASDGSVGNWRLMDQGIDFGNIIGIIDNDEIVFDSDGVTFFLQKVSEDQTLPGTEGLPTEETQAETAASGLRPEFLKAMDTYEAFYDEYCTLMKQYKANPTDLSFLTKYMNMLSKQEDIDSAFKAWDSNDLSSEELKYYLDVTARIQKKMIDLL